MTPLIVTQEKQKRGCHRCGHCCEALPLNKSPKELKDLHMSRSLRKMAPECGETPDWLDDFFRDRDHLTHIEELLPFPKRELISTSGITRDPTDKRDDIFEIAIMIEGRYHGHQTVPCDRHVFGPCNHLRRDKNGLASCAIHATKPNMCRVYPYNEPQEKFLPNPSYIKGCGYNKDPNAGWTPQELLDAAKP